MRLIATQALQDFWIANRTRGHGFLFVLPAGRTTRKRLRSAKAGRGPQPITNSPAHPAATESVLREFLKTAWLQLPRRYRGFLAGPHG